MGKEKSAHVYILKIWILKSRLKTKPKDFSQIIYFVFFSQLWTKDERAWEAIAPWWDYGDIECTGQYRFLEGAALPMRVPELIPLDQIDICHQLHVSCGCSSFPLTVSLRDVGIFCSTQPSKGFHVHLMAPGRMCSLGVKYFSWISKHSLEGKWSVISLPTMHIFPNTWKNRESIFSQAYAHVIKIYFS